MQSKDNSEIQLYFFPSVLPPGVNITLNHTAPLYAGTGLTLTCTVILDSNVNNNERVMTEWSGLQDISKEQYSVTGACGSGNIYAGSLAISHLAEGNSTYTCTVTVTGGSNVQAANASNGVTITVIGKNTYLLLAELLIEHRPSSSSSARCHDISSRLNSN